MKLSSWDKLLSRILSLSNDLRFDELRKVLEEYGYEMKAPRRGSSHYTFRKAGLYANHHSETRTYQKALCGNGKGSSRKRGEES